MLDYLVKGRARRELFRVIWRLGVVGNISDLARRAKVTFSAAHRELEAMRAAGLARAERSGTEVVYQAQSDHPQATLLRQLANAPAGAQTQDRASHDNDVRGWLAAAGAPLGWPQPNGPMPPLEETLAVALALSHRDATVARVLPLVLWRQRERLDLDRLVQQASRRDERPALGYFLELAGQIGGDLRLVRAARALRDRRRTGTRPFFTGPQGRHAVALARRNTPKEALRWGYVMNMGLDSFRAMFEKATDSMHLTYLDNDAIIAATGEPAAKQFILALRATSYIAVSATVLHELAFAPPAQRQRRILTLLEVAHGYSTDQCPDVLREVFVRAPIPESATRQLRGIDGLRVFLGPNAPQPQTIFGRPLPDPLGKMMREIHRGTPRGKIGTFKEFFYERAKAHVLHLAQIAATRGLIPTTEHVEAQFSEIIQRKQVFSMVAMQLATMYRALLNRGRGRDGCFSDLRTVVETSHADVFLTRDVELIECSKLVREAFPQFPLEVRRLPGTSPQ